MPAPKRPNTAAATAAVVRKAQDRKAEELREAGWLVVAPDNLTYREAVDRLNDRHYAIREQIDAALAKLGLAMRRFDVLADPGHEMVNSFARVADLVRELRPDMRVLRQILPRATRMRRCQGCGRAGGELTENGCPTCGPDAEIAR